MLSTALRRNASRVLARVVVSVVAACCLAPVAAAQCPSCDRCQSCDQSPVCDGCPPGTSTRPADDPSAPTPAEAWPPATEDFAPVDDTIQPLDSGIAQLPSGLGATSSPTSPSVHMIGDFFGNGYFLATEDPMYLSDFATVPIAGGDRRFKATDNLSPVPTDRVFFNYHHFHNAVVDIFGDKQSVDRFTFGLENTFFNEMMSLEVRVPFVSGLNSVQDPTADSTLTSEFGNVSLTLKTRLCQAGTLTFVSGLATVLPTADDGSISDGFATTVFENRAVHLQPYLGINCSDPNSRFFSTIYMAVDVDVNGNRVLTGPTGEIEYVGDVRDQTLLFADWQVGYWCYQDYGHIGYLNAVAPVLEMHYTRTLDNPDLVTGVENPFGTVDLLNITAGLVFDFRQTMTLTVYGAAPLIRNETMIDDVPVSPVFQAEFGAQAVWNY